MTINNFTFFSPTGTEFPVSANADGKLYQILAGMTIKDYRRKDWESPVDTALNRQYTNTSLVVGGRYFELVGETVNLTASTLNYVHANVDLTNTTAPVSVSVEAVDNTNSIDINNGSGVLKYCFDVIETDTTQVINSYAPNQNYTIAGDMTASGAIKAASMSTTKDTPPVTLSGAGSPTGKVTYQRINGVVYITGAGNWGNVTTGETKTMVTLPAGFRPHVTYETAGSPMGGTRSCSWKVNTNGTVAVTFNPGGGSVYSGFSMSYPAVM